MLRIFAALVLLAASTRALPDVSTYCDSVTLDGDYCASCLQTVYCDITGGTGTIEKDDCDPGYVCETFPNNNAACVELASATDCPCSSNICDPYNADYEALCDGEEVSDIVDCSLYEEQCVIGSCVTCVGSPDAWRPIPPTCSTGYRCISEAIVDSWECDSSEYIFETGQCLPAPPAPCAGSCSGDCPDLTDCSQYYYCDGFGGVVGDVKLCASGLYFDPTSIPPGCQGDRTLCSPWTDCSFASTSSGEEILMVTDFTTEPTVADIVAAGSDPIPPKKVAREALPTCTGDTLGNYSDGPCSSQYWSCQKEDDGVFKYARMQCDGGLVFDSDPNYPHCGLLEHVKDCDGLW